MHVALIISEERLLHEHSMLNRLVIGLIDEGLRVTRIVPALMSWEHVLLGEQRIALASRLETDMKVLPWSRKRRATLLAAEMEKNPPDVIYAVGEGAWQAGMDLADFIERPVLLNVWNARLARRVPRGRHARMVGGYITPTKALREVLCQSIDPALVSAAPMGVALPSEPRPIFARPEASVAIAVVGGCRDVPAYRAMLGGLSRVNREYPQLQIFLELRGPHQHEIWRYGQKLRLLDRISTIHDASPHRRLLTQCDMMLLPERYGELYSIMLEAMGGGMVVIASHDPMIEMLQAEETARVASVDSPEEWAQLIRRTIQDPDGSRQLGLRARAVIGARHSTNIQAGTLIDVFDQVVSGGAYSFSDAARTAVGA